MQKDHPGWKHLNASLRDKVEILAKNPYRFYIYPNVWTFRGPSRLEVLAEFRAEAEVKFRLGKSFQWELESYDPDLGWGDEFEGEFSLEGVLNDGHHAPVTISLAADCPVVRPLSMHLQLEEFEADEITGFYDFGQPLQRFLDALEEAKRMHLEMG